MAVFAAAFTATQSSTGLVITITDTSNYSTNDQGYTMSDFTTREFILTDYAGAALETIPIPDGETVVTYDITSDEWINITLNLAGVASYTKYQRYPFDRITINKLEEALIQGCCQSAKNKSNLCMANAFINGAQYVAPLGNASKFNQNITAANSYLDLIV